MHDGESEKDLSLDEWGEDLNDRKICPVLYCGVQCVFRGAVWEENHASNMVLVIQSERKIGNRVLPHHSAVSTI